jgi:4-oxalocrotonate tautomerase
MPYVNVKIVRDGVTVEQKAQVIKEMTEVLVRVLNKDPARTFVVIEEVDLENWGVAGVSTLEHRKSQHRS